MEVHYSISSTFIVRLKVFKIKNHSVLSLLFQSHPFSQKTLLAICIQNARHTGQFTIPCFLIPCTSTLYFCYQYSLQPPQKFLETLQSPAHSVSLPFPKHAKWLLLQAFVLLVSFAQYLFPLDSTLSSFHSWIHSNVILSKSSHASTLLLP